MLKYDYSIHEIWTGNDEDGKKNTESWCIACNKWHKGNYGFEFSCRTRGCYKWIRVKLCPSCAKKYAEMLKRIGDELTKIAKDGEE